MTVLRYRIPKQLLFAALLSVSACGAPRGPRWTPAPQPASEHFAVVTRAEGATVGVGDGCWIRLSRVVRGDFNCKVELTCRNEIVYGRPNSGYNFCQEIDGELVSAADDQPSNVDGDPAMELDLREGKMTLEDAVPYLRIRVEIPDDSSS